AGHGAHDEDALESQIDAAAALGDALAEAHEQKGRAHADGAAQDRQRHAPPAERRHGQARAGRKIFSRPYSASLARISMKATPCRTSTVASGKSRRRCSMPPLAAMPPTSTATGTIAMGFWRAMNATRMPP